jgi:hypothetical protein
MLLMGKIPWLRVDNFLNFLVQTYDDDEDLATIATHMICKL